MSQASTSWLNGLAAITCVSLAQSDVTGELRGLFNVAAGTAGELGINGRDVGGRLVARAKFATSIYGIESADNAHDRSKETAEHQAKLDKAKPPGGK